MGNKFSRAVQPTRHLSLIGPEEKGPFRGYGFSKSASAQQESEVVLKI